MEVREHFTHLTITNIFQLKTRKEYTQFTYNLSVKYNVVDI